MAVITGTPGNDDLDGTGESDVFRLQHGGVDMSDGSGGDDVFKVGAALTNADTIIGGAGYDTIVLDGDYSPVSIGSLILFDNTIEGIERLRFATGNTYSVTTHDDSVAAGERLDVDGSALILGEELTFIGSSETDGRFRFMDGGCNDTLIGGAQDDVFLLKKAGGSDTAVGMSGDDRFYMGATLDATDHIDGARDFDTVYLDGDYSGGNGLVCTLGTIARIDLMVLAAGHSYDITTIDASVTSRMTVDASALDSSESLHFDASLERKAELTVFGGGGADTVTTGRGDDLLVSGLGADVLTSGKGADTYEYVGASESSSTTHDTLIGFDADADRFDTSIAVTSVGTNSGSASLATFDADLNVAIADALLNEAAVITITGGDLSGRAFLVLDVNDDEAYSAGDDLVFDITGYTGTVDAADFI